MNLTLTRFHIQINACRSMLSNVFKGKRKGEDGRSGEEEVIWISNHHTLFYFLFFFFLLLYYRETEIKIIIKNLLGLVWQRRNKSKKAFASKTGSCAWPLIRSPARFPARDFSFTQNSFIRIIQKKFYTLIPLIRLPPVLECIIQVRFLHKRG